MPYPKRWMTETGRVCRTCKLDQPLTSFYKVSKDREWYSTECKSCYKARDGEARRKRFFRAARNEKHLCSGCSRTMTSENFSAEKTAKSGRKTRCKDCERDTQRLRRARNLIRNSKNLSALLVGTKRCSTCHRVLARNMFPPALPNKDGLSNSCRQCRLASNWSFRFGQRLTWLDIPGIVPTSCLRCGWSHELPVCHLHHVISPRQGGTHDASNLVSVCANCHQLLHMGL
jgi:hypothetical protein